MLGVKVSWGYVCGFRGNRILNSFNRPIAVVQYSSTYTSLSSASLVYAEGAMWKEVVPTCSSSNVSSAEGRAFGSPDQQRLARARHASCTSTGKDAFRLSVRKRFGTGSNVILLAGSPPGICTHAAFAASSALVGATSSTMDTVVIEVGGVLPTAGIDSADTTDGFALSSSANVTFPPPPSPPPPAAPPAAAPPAVPPAVLLVIELAEVIELVFNTAPALFSSRTAQRAPNGGTVAPAPRTIHGMADMGVSPLPSLSAAVALRGSLRS